MAESKSTAVKSVKNKKHMINGKTAEKLRLYSLCAIPVFLVFLFAYVPMGGIIIAFKDYRFNLGIFGSEWTGLKNFEFFLKSPSFLLITRNTLFLNFLFIFFGTVASVSVGVLLFEMRSTKATKLFQTVMIMPNFISWVIAAYMAYAILNPQYGMLNAVLNSFGIESIDWYSKPEAWPAILTISSIWKTVGINSVIYYAGLMGIDTGLFEAARIDGANKWQQIIHISLPNLLSLIIMLTILSIGNIFRADFGLFYQLTRDVAALYPTTDVIDTYIFRTMRVVGDMGMSAAVGFLQSIVGFVLVVITNLTVKKIKPESALF
ncbi:MAG: sugar ABC transporter permease [Clostridia bacterium]|nr:sugar ABC transporter permease [Clostridia bacterium]